LIWSLGITRQGRAQLGDRQSLPWGYVGIITVSFASPAPWLVRVRDSDLVYQGRSIELCESWYKHRYNSIMKYSYPTRSLKACPTPQPTLSPSIFFSLNAPRWGISDVPRMKSRCADSVTNGGLKNLGLGGGGHGGRD
jgi:hypothetical protein